MIGACLLVAGALRATIPAASFTVEWLHSVEKTRWEEQYRVEAGRLVLAQARIEASGAGMDPPPDARLVDGWWRWRPAMAPLRELRLTVSPFTADYRICWSGGCHPLHVLSHVDDIEVVTVRPCSG